jgi:putative glycosyltransferase
MQISIVATLYKSETHVDEFCRRASQAARQLVGDDYELVLVNDGSPDRSVDRAIALGRQDGHIIVVDLSRNFGHHKAMMTGLEHATGERVFLIDSDLEEQPEWLQSFADQMRLDHCDVVYGVQAKRRGGRFERWTGYWFYRVFKLLTGLALPENVVTARLMSRRYVTALLRHDEREIFMAGLWHITGFDQRPQAVSKTVSSQTTYTLRRKLSILVNSVTSFSNAPLVGIFYAGVSISTLAGLYIVYLLIKWAFLATPLSGWTSVIGSIWLVGGMIISFIGVVGIYLAKIYSETKRRPYTIVKDIHRRSND